jgi:hypothetical protein
MPTCRNDTTNEDVNYHHDICHSVRGFRHGDEAEANLRLLVEDALCDGGPRGRTARPAGAERRRAVGGEDKGALLDHAAILEMEGTRRCGAHGNKRR